MSGMMSVAIRLLYFVNRNTLAVLTNALETNYAGNLGEQGIVRTSANTYARMDLGAALTNQNVASRNYLTVCTLDTQALSLGVTAVLSRTYALLMSKKL